MRLLLDTHILIWALALPDHLSPRARAYLDDSENTVMASLVSTWEIAVKRSVHADSIPIPAADIPLLCAESGIDLLTIRPKHIELVESLPFHHQDPFDRLLIAQAMIEPLRLLTHDHALAAYGSSVIVV